MNQVEQDELELGLRVTAFLTLEEEIRYEVPVEKSDPWGWGHPWARWFIDCYVPECSSSHIVHGPGLRSALK